MKQQLIERPYFTLKVNHRENDEDDKAVIKEMFLENVYRFECHMLEQEHPIVFDVGANIGTFTMLVLCVAFENNIPVTIYAVEPEEHNLEILQQNLDDNPILFEKGAEVVIVKAGVGSENKKASITNGSGSSRVTDRTDELQEITLMTYDNLLKYLKVDKVDFTKVDIEGSEVPMLKFASKKTITSSHYYAIEFDRFNKVDDFFTILGKFTSDFSFSTYGIPKNGCNMYFENHHWEKS